jgi:nicotinamide-nucleotide adenylyltransferase
LALFSFEEVFVKKKALFVGRFAPPHKGHIEAIIKLVSEFDEVLIGLGSCYEVGSPRHPFLAVYREKMILLSLHEMGCDLSRIKIAHVQDFKDFEQWIEHILILVKKEQITHFVTGNEKDILNVLKEKNMKLDLDFINPELGSIVPYHATDLRKAIVEGDYNKFLEIAAPGTIALMGSVNGFQGIREAIENDAPQFYGGRQTVDVVLTLSEKLRSRGGQDYYKDYVLCGTRPDKDKKKEFPNYLGIPGNAIETFESPLNAAVRTLKEKANLDVELLDMQFEPSPISITFSKTRIITTMSFLKLFNSSDIRLAGSEGGSSQCYHIPLYGGIEEFNRYISDTKDLSDLKFIRIEDALAEGLAYEQTGMVLAASKRLNH